MSALRLFCTGLLIAATAAGADPFTRALAVERARPMPPRIERESLAENPVIGTASLSPDGRLLAFTWIAGDERSLWIQPTAPGAGARRILPRAGKSSLSWSGDSRWLFLSDESAVRSISVADEPGSGLLAELGGKSKAQFLGPDPWSPAAIVVDRDHGRWQLWRIAPGARRTLLAFSRHQIVDAAIGRNDRAAFLKLTDGERHLILARNAAGLLHPVAQCAQLRRCDLLGVTGDGNAVWMASDLGGDRRALVRLDLSGRVTRVQDDPHRSADVKQVVFDRRTGTPVLAQFLSTGPMLVGLDPAARSGLARLRLPGILTVETSSKVWLVEQEDSMMQGRRWYLFDPRTGHRRLVLDDQPLRISPAKLARTMTFTFPASDGFAVHGLLSVPPGRDLRSAPLVTVVHGGPWAHDEVGYSSLVQLLTNRGMIVFQPQFRGSTGFGRAYVFAANGDYGDGRVQRDIEDGTRWLLARGIGDRRRSAIVGASFGGYSTLEALSNGSNLYSAGVAIVPPTDFSWIMRWAADRTDLGEADGVPFGAVQRVMGMNLSDPAVAKRLHDQSPRARVARMRTPLLLIAAGRDERVPIRSVIDYAAELKAHHAPARIVVGTKLHHSNKDELAGKAALYLVEDMFARVWGGPAAAPPSLAVKRWMESNMRVL
ncbi:S9 family peptidase [Sphingomonas sp.]|uniref:S9 family peptidase n=1 Tax=Sphingomonas sp. TaxID=28214 RepID=UPI002DB5BDAC|nr:prolyl oligopeptidase family serine peptidase [Sphingomonas sp.]HEU4968789.1 prolyl oligopeptidase family serine peptidase [Sphingomonas sp.]